MRGEHHLHLADAAAAGLPTLFRPPHPALSEMAWQGGKPGRVHAGVSSGGGARFFLNDFKADELQPLPCRSPRGTRWRAIRFLDMLRQSHPP